MNLKSLDTNILLYAINVDCAEHKNCSALVRTSIEEPGEWIVADQVWFELYRLLRNNVVLKKPLSAKDASEAISYYRHKMGWLHCAWDVHFMKQLETVWNVNSFSASKSFDLILAITLKNFGVKTFYTRNTKDFEKLKFFNLVNPIINL
jgi:predicted nucleic acid-binding protein